MTTNILEKLNNYHSLVLHKYIGQEKLIRLLKIDDYYKKNGVHYSGEKLTTNVNFAEKLSKDLVMPLEVEGVFLTEGRPYKKFYTVEELRKAADNPVNHRFPLCLDHKDTEVSSIIGVVNDIWYDETIKGLRWSGEINDETMARNVLSGAISQVSVTVYSSQENDRSLGIVGKELLFKELSLVWKGAEPNNTIKVKGKESHTDGFTHAINKFTNNI